MPTRARTHSLERPRAAGGSRVLLVGAGPGEATCGILYLASFLRRNGVEACVRLTDADESDAELFRSLAALVAHVRPGVVGISLKWFHHLARALVIARALRAIDPRLRIVLGGNTASFFCAELLAHDCVDAVVLGDGEVPLLALSRGDDAPPNVVTRSSQKVRTVRYVQRASTSDVYYSHFDELFLSQLDLHSYSGWVAPGKGCGENCLYCAGTRGMQQATFGRAEPFLRPEAAVRADHREIAPRTWQLRYDFGGGTADYLERVWRGVDLSGHCVTWFLWGVPAPRLAATLAWTFERAHLVLDIGCFSELQRLELRRRGLLKPCPTDAELVGVIEACLRHPNLQLEISGIAGLPFASARTLAQERQLVERVLGLGCAVGYQRLEAQPGALVTEHPERFGMATQARTFAEFLDYFDRRAPGGSGVPMIRFLDRALETAVQRTSDEVDALVFEQAAKARGVRVNGRTRLRSAAASTRCFELGDWLGRYRVPGRLAREPVTVLRSPDGTGLSCAPSVEPADFCDAALQQGDDARALLAVLGAFERPTAVDAAVARLKAKQRLDARTSRELIGHLADGRFLCPA